MASRIFMASLYTDDQLWSLLAVKVLREEMWSDWLSTSVK
jgi:hypothetical protein